MLKNIQEIQQSGLVWVNITKQGEKELAEAKKRFGLLDADIKESLPPFQRPKIVKRDDYYYLILHFPVFDRETMRLGFTEIDFFLSGSYIITVHGNHLSVLQNFFDECKKGTEARNKYFTGTAVHIFFEIINRLLESIFPILLHVNEDINRVDRKLFSAPSGRVMAEEILRLKTNIVTFRRTMQGHRTVLDRLVMYSGRDLDISSFQTYINNLREFTNEIWHMLESQKESINALHETNESLLALRTSEIMKTLTVISVITFPLTLFVAWTDSRLSGNFFNVTGGFFIMSLLVLAGAAFMMYMFRRKNWL